MPETIATLPSGVEICHETLGDPADPTILLVMGLGCPMNWWPVDFCEALVAEGFHVVRFDNRDTGRSTRFRDHRVRRGDVVKAFVGRPVAVPYALTDMADDGFGLMDDLGVERAHVVGVSMGGMVAQTMAIARPERVLSLTSIMSTTGNRRVGWQHPRLMAGLLKPVGRTRDEYVARSLYTAKAIGSPGWDVDEAMVLERAGETFDRGWSGSGVLRQMLAILTQPDRTPALRTLDVPACAVHGLADPMVHSSGGRATAGAIPGAELVTIPHMGHDMPAATRRTLVDAVVRTARRAHAAA
ncbi:MAG: alpha/beta hydrolase [Nocardioidaceae bacterium]|nr:alpha/beta hydrolase [Nocardioidaceae bacterium]